MIDFEEYQPTAADLSLFKKLEGDDARVNMKSYVISDHGHTILLEISREVAIRLLENVGGIGGLVVNDGSTAKPRMVLINKYAIEIAQDLWVYNHDGNYRLTAPRDKVVGGDPFALRLRSE